MDKDLNVTLKNVLKGWKSQYLINVQIPLQIYFSSNMPADWRKGKDGNTCPRAPL